MAGKQHMATQADEIRARQRTIDTYLEYALGHRLTYEREGPQRKSFLDGEPATQQEILYAAILAAPKAIPDASGEGGVAEPGPSGRLAGDEREAGEGAAGEDDADVPPARLVGPGRVPEDRGSRDAPVDRDPPDEGVAVRGDAAGPRSFVRDAQERHRARGPLVPPAQGHVSPADAQVAEAAPAPSGPIFAFFSWRQIVDLVTPAIAAAHKITKPKRYNVEYEPGGWGVTFRVDE